MDAVFPQNGRVPFLPGLIFVLGLLAGCGQDDAPDDDTGAIHAPEIARIVPAEEALAGAHIPTLDPATMNGAQIRKAVGAGPGCEFRYTAAGKPALAVSMGAAGETVVGIVRLNGNLVVLEPAPIDGDVGQGADFSLAAPPIRITVSPDAGEPAEGRDGVRHREANMIFEVGQRLKVGYRGYLDCLSEPAMVDPAPGA
ncbi:hypothetical protein JL101_021055 [Skermanella rosea]|uniref:DUF6692 family protein n=1 Tax=Skermanella rosea TaxID=1817965 RepID=UPI001931CD95|nr:DUF6692 family protein [Skermanella rosea]UEM02457.1 hypothetical protein JL101_021055 [Skermanella rosea]